MTELLEENQVDVTKFYSKKGHTMLIESVIKNRPKATRILIDHVRQTSEGKTAVTAYVNKPSTSQFQFNALHYAAFYGRLE